MKYLLSFVFIVLVGIMCLVPCMNELNEGTSNSVLKTSIDVSNYLAEKYRATNVKNIRTTAGVENRLNSENYNQTDIKEYYNNHNGKDTDLSDSSGICWCSTAISILKFNGVEEDANVLGNSMIEYVTKTKKWITSTNTGISNIELSKLLTYEFDINEISKKGNTDFLQLL